jgi:hypothetical protein
MIRSWRNSVSRKVWEGAEPSQFRGLDFEAATDLLLALNVAKTLAVFESVEKRRTSQAQGRSQEPMGDDRESAVAHLL